MTKKVRTNQWLIINQQKNFWFKYITNVTTTTSPQKVRQKIQSLKGNYVIKCVEVSEILAGYI